MAYADYIFYTNTYLGSAIAETSFPQLALRASAVIDQITFDRAADETIPDVVNKIKLAMCALAEELQKQDYANGADGIASESQGQYSVSFAANSSRMKSNQSKLESVAKLWLANTTLLFAGFYAGEYGGTSDP